MMLTVENRFWATYKAITRRYGGPFTGSTGSYDFNKQL